MGHRNVLGLCAASSIALLLALAPSVNAAELQQGSWLKCGDGLTLYIGAIEPFTQGKTAVHVQMLERGRVIAGHLPFAATALVGCRFADRKLQADKAVLQEGLQLWRDAEGGIYTIAPREVRQIIKQQTGI